MLIMTFSNEESDFLNAFRKMKAEAHRQTINNYFTGDNLSPEELYEQIYGTKAKPQQGPPTGRLPPIDDPAHFFDNLRRAMNALPKNKPAAPVVNKETRIKQINTELDIIRGRVPTPPNYRIDPLRVKALMKELNQLTA